MASKGRAHQKAKIPDPKKGSKSAPTKQVSDASAIDTDELPTGTKPWLMDMLYQHAESKGMTISDLNEKLGYSHGYLFTLRARPEKCTKLGMETVRKLAEFLGVDSVTVMVAAGILQPSDFFGVRDVREIRGELTRSVRYISEDPDWAPFVPRPIESLDDRTLMLVVYAYQRATKRQLMQVTSPSETIDGGREEATRRSTRK